MPDLAESYPGHRVFDYPVEQNASGGSRSRFEISIGVHEPGLFSPTWTFSGPVDGVSSGAGGGLNAVWVGYQ